MDYFFFKIQLNVTILQYCTLKLNKTSVVGTLSLINQKKCQHLFYKRVYILHWDY